MALPQHPLTKEQIDAFLKAGMYDFSRPNPLVPFRDNVTRRDTIKIPRPWSWHIRRFWDRLLKRVGLREREPVTISWSQVTITRDLER